MNISNLATKNLHPYSVDIRLVLVQLAGKGRYLFSIAYSNATFDSSDSKFNQKTETSDEESSA
ncbi:hypothetical protein LZD49_00905 [Dyadobacter sp. CY261]|uniref:hypothetical protein n=1 Tax=Dyadobacter sp. CY261 TaxID=2907203 RepID=UPI001F203F77|nr:hypothetical protein [Dyadobacter sp. CY261]MCF0069007.1 hypothetical protein [Dyadobacter sp. CY261]